MLDLSVLLSMVNFFSGVLRQFLTAKKFIRFKSVQLKYLFFNFITLVRTSFIQFLSPYDYNQSNFEQTGF